MELTTIATIGVLLLYGSLLLVLAIHELTESEEEKEKTRLGYVH